MWPDGNSAGQWVTPWPMVLGWVLLVVSFVAVVCLVASFTASALAPQDEGDD